MSLSININKVTDVLLADGWHKVKSFDLDSYEYVDPEWFESYNQKWILHKGGESKITATGFVFISDDPTEYGVTIKGPLSSIIAIKEKTEGR
ncbi:MAG: hypothetical protein BWX92_02532 [Deltaproteobacteria bacterium ADurb.Bin135]|jgi:hypothetical protein|nr:MAG: hypothetical protein BWX92_02532 [Deltaproteobacteria bacterium ADurb.Bin135]